MVVNIAEVRPGLFLDQLGVEAEQAVADVNQGGNGVLHFQQLPLQLVDLGNGFPAGGTVEDTCFYLFKFFTQGIEDGEILVYNGIHYRIKGKGRPLTQ